MTFARPHTCVVEDGAGACKAGGLGVVRTRLLQELLHDGDKVRELLVKVLLVVLERARSILPALGHL